jgi:hypothetical protein
MLGGLAVDVVTAYSVGVGLGGLLGGVAVAGQEAWELRGLVRGILRY